MRISKIPAFTLTEMLIVLTISAIVAGLAFTIIGLFGRNIHIIQNNYSQSTKRQLLEQQLSIDFNRFHDLYFNSEQNELLLKTPMDSVVYSFDEYSIIRGTDTVFSSGFSKVFFLNGQTVGSGRVDALKLSFVPLEDKYLFIYKERDALSYFRTYGN